MKYDRLRVRSWRRPQKSGGLVAIALIALFVLMPTGPLWANPSSVGTYTVPWGAYRKAFLINLHDHGFKLPERSYVPQVCLFSPAGKMLATEGEDVNSAVTFLQSTLPEAETATPLSDKPAWTLFADSIAKSLSGKVPPSLKKTEDGVWTLLLLSTTMDACEHCAQFEQLVAAAQAREPKHLRVVVVKMERN